MSLQQYYALRLQESALKAQIAAITPAATDEALEWVASEEKKTFPIGDGKHKIQVSFRTKKVKHTDDQELGNLHAEIELETQAAQLANAETIAQIEQDLESLTKRLEQLSNTDQGRLLQRQYDKRAKALEEKVPVLALKGV